MARDRSRRSRSRSPRRKRKSRSRSRERVRKRSRERKRSRSRERKRSRSRDRKRAHKSRSRSPVRDRSRKAEKRGRSSSPVLKFEGAINKDEPLALEAEQKRLEEEMQKRRDRIDKWRLERKKGKEEPQTITILPPSKKWSLEDDDDEEDVINPSNQLGEDEVDPLDAYMQGVNDEVSKIKGKTGGNKAESRDSPVPSGPAVKEEKDGAGKPGTSSMLSSMVMGFAKQIVEDPAKGELMESNADLMEYSSEEERDDDLGEAMQGLRKPKKELALVDHNKIYYRPFRKNFYIEVPEIARLTEEQVNVYREELENIKAKGKNIPKPIQAWAQCGVSKKILTCLKKHGFESPTPIQAQAIPSIMSGRDLIGIAKTGSGKTLAFLLPMFRHIMDQPELEEDDGPIAMILTPTRELALQIAKECKKFTRALGLECICVYGGTGISEQIAELKRGTDMIVCTPGRMIDMLSANGGRVTNLRRITYIVLDEADRMFDMGFEPQVMRIIDNCRADRQTVMFSATFPRQMEALARRVLQKPIEVQVGGRSVVCSDVQQHITILEEEQKVHKTLELLGLYQESGSVLIFVDTQENCDELMKTLMSHSYPCMSLHGGIDQHDRDSTIDDFKKGNIQLMIATSVAARGLDVPSLILVINFDCPNHMEDYVHRCGRTGRAGNKGHAYTYLSSEQGRYAGEIIRALTDSGVEVPAELTKLWEGYKAEQEAQGKKVRSISGFQGKGFKFDETEQHLANERKMLQKAALGLQDSDDEDAGKDIDQHIDDMFNSRKRVTDVAAPLSNQVNQPLATTNQAKLDLAKKLASRIHIAKNIGAEAMGITQQATVAFMKGGGFQGPQVSSKTIAEQMAEKINQKLGYRPKEEEEEEDKEPEGETFKRYEEELEINDFPQTARWKVTSKDALGQISEYSEAGITVRGSYYSKGKEPKEDGDERKLYLAIEATTELAVSSAKKEITRLIKEELIRLQNSYQPISKGRYKVM